MAVTSACFASTDIAVNSDFSVSVRGLMGVDGGRSPDRGGRMLCDGVGVVVRVGREFIGDAGDAGPSGAVDASDEDLFALEAVFRKVEAREVLLIKVKGLD